MQNVYLRVPDDVVMGPSDLQHMQLQWGGAPEDEDDMEQTQLKLSKNKLCMGQLW